MELSLKIETATWFILVPWIIEISLTDTRWSTTPLEAATKTWTKTFFFLLQITSNLKLINKCNGCYRRVAVADTYFAFIFRVSQSGALFTFSASIQMESGSRAAAMVERRKTYAWKIKSNEIDVGREWNAEAGGRTEKGITRLMEINNLGWEK